MKKKWFICIAALLCIVLLFTGCPKIESRATAAAVAARREILAVQEAILIH